MKVVDLNIYPVKSMGGVSVPQINLDRFGPQWDRRWMLVNPDGQFITQREEARMALISASMDAQNDGTRLMIQAGNLEAKSVGINSISGEKKRVTVWGDTCEGELINPELDRYLSEFLELECQLVYMPEATQRLVDTNYASSGETVGFADGFPILLISTASLDAINSDLEQPVTMQNFRPNIVVDGCESFAEDEWHNIRIGDVAMQVVKPCSRCVIPSINPQTAEKDSAVLRVLNKQRKRDDGKVYLGQNVIYQLDSQETPSISVGDSVLVLD